MLNIKNAFRFIIKGPFQSLIVLLAVLVSVSVQFFILSLGLVLDSMILEQTTNYQDHIVLRNVTLGETNYKMLDFNLKSELKQIDKNINFVNYFLLIDGDIIKVDGETITPSIRLNFHAYDDFNKNGDYLEYTGLNKKEHLVGNSNVLDPNKDEVMLDVNYARNNNLIIGQTITYKSSLSNELYNFKIVGLYDLGLVRIQNNYTYLSLDRFNNLASENFTLNIQLHKVSQTKTALNNLKEHFKDLSVTYKTWEEVIPEINILNKAQKVVILVIEIFISFAFFIVILSVLNYTIKTKYSQFGILKAIGQTSKDIRNTLMAQTFIIALLGVIIGLILGSISITTYARLMTYPDGTQRFFVKLSINNYLIPLALTMFSALMASFVSFLRIRKLTIIGLIKE